MFVVNKQQQEKKNLKKKLTERRMNRLVFSTFITLMSTVNKKKGN